MTAPTRQHGMTQAQRDKQCSGKRRYADEATARAMGVTQHERSGTPLWVYRCDQCRGWHLTRSDNGPAANVMGQRPPAPTLAPAHARVWPDYLK